MGAQLGRSVAFGSGCGQALPGVPRNSPLCLLFKVLVAARAFFKQRNPGVAEAGSVKVLFVARAISKRQNSGAEKNGSVKVSIEGLCVTRA